MTLRSKLTFKVSYVRYVDAKAFNFHVVRVFVSIELPSTTLVNCSIATNVKTENQQCFHININIKKYYSQTIKRLTTQMC